jgi:hypothetical protein
MQPGVHPRGRCHGRSLLWLRCSTCAWGHMMQCSTLTKPWRVPLCLCSWRGMRLDVSSSNQQRWCDGAALACKCTGLCCACAVLPLVCFDVVSCCFQVWVLTNRAYWPALWQLVKQGFCEAAALHGGPGLPVWSAAVSSNFECVASFQLLVCVSLVLLLVIPDQHLTGMTGQCVKGREGGSCKLPR